MYIDQNYNSFPLGGVLSGAGMNGTLFNPYLAGEGFHFTHSFTTSPELVLFNFQLLYCRGDSPQQLNVTTSGGTITGVGVYFQHAGGENSYNNQL